MRIPDIPAIALGGYGLLCLTGKMELPPLITNLANKPWIASCLENSAKYPGTCRVCLYLAAGSLLLSGLLHIFLEPDMARFFWGIGSAALAFLFITGLNDALFAWAYESKLYSAGTTHLVLTIFHFLWEFGCPFCAFAGAYVIADSYSQALMPFWVIPVCAMGGFLVSLVPYGILLLLLIPCNYIFVYVDKLFIILGLIVCAILLRFGLI